MSNNLEEKLFPISINPNFCIRCEKCSYSCPTKAIFFRDTLRYVDYNKCKGCLKCVEVCEHGAIEVISIEEGTLKGFNIDPEKCTLCGACLKEKFCFQQLFELNENSDGKKCITFRKDGLSECFKCLKCFKSCPTNAIVPEIE